MKSAPGRRPFAVTDRADAELLSVERQGDVLTYRIRGGGPHLLRFQGKVGEVSVRIASDQALAFTRDDDANGHWSIAADLPMGTITISVRALR